MGSSPPPLDTASRINPMSSVATSSGESALDKESVAESPPRPMVTLRTRTHAALFVAVATLGLVLAMPHITYFDITTLKPRNMDPTLKYWAMLTNRPIKLGLVHLAFYGIEFFKDPALFQRHIGQRLSTLWWQFLFQHERWGQHLQMQIETCMQIADVFHRQSQGLVSYNLAQLGVFTLVLLLMLAQAAFTSLGWHNFDEQFSGFALGVLKLYFDYGEYGSKFNWKLGKVFTLVVHWAGGIFLLVVGHAANGFEALHPTLTITLFFFGVAILSFVAPRILHAAKSWGQRARTADVPS